MSVHPTNIEAAKLLREHWPAYSKLSDDQIFNWIGFFSSKKLLGIVKNEEGKCVGVGAFRFLNSLEESKNINNNFPDGHIVWIEIAIGTEPHVVQSLWMGMMRLCSKNVTKLGGLRKGVARLYDFERYCKLIMNERITYGRK
jgi:hypothetical protein